MYAVPMDADSRDFFTDPGLAADPYEYYDRLRDEPVRTEPHHGVMVVSGYDEFTAVCRDDRDHFSACNSLERLLERMGNIRSDDAVHGTDADRRFEWEPTFLLRRLRSLHLQFESIG
jgi:cytochrome P450